jgi:putative ABC transport system substrate-binding protein
VNRREFIAGLGGTVAWPLAVRAQRGERMPRVGVIAPYPQGDREGEARVAAFLETFRKLG